MTDPASEPIRPAATVVLWRDAGNGAEVLMGQRGAAAAFMPSKYVFPGGAVDPGDATHPLEPGWTHAECHARLGADAAPLIHAARRELTEETALTLTLGATPPLRFIFRAITPPGRSRRFDARFFLAPLSSVRGDSTRFSADLTELSHLHWIGVKKARTLDLPFITEVVLAEVAALLAGIPQHGVPFFDNSGPVPTFRRLTGTAP